MLRNVLGIKLKKNNNDHKFKLIPDNLRFILTILVVFLIGITVLVPNIIISLIALFTLFMLIITGDESDDFYVYIALIPFFNLITINQKNILFIYLFISTVKLILKQSTIKLNLNVIFIIFLLLIEVLNDFGKSKIGELLFVIFPMIYFLSFITFADLKTKSFKKIQFYLIFGFVTAIIITLVGTKGNLLSNLNQQIRFGSHVTIIGGPMDIPIYCLIIISLLTTNLFIYKVDINYKLLFLILIIMSFIIGFLTISRVFILGLIVMVLCILPALIKNFKKSIKFLIALSLVFLLIVLLNYNASKIIFNNFIGRIFVDDISTGRFDITKDAINYLLTNIKALLFGEGIINYVNIGKSGNYGFKQMAHNLFIDGIMAWGIIGVTLLSILYFYFIIKCKKIYKNRITLIGLTPLIVIGACYLTSGTFTYFYTYLYLITLLILVFRNNGSKDTIL